MSQRAEPILTIVDGGLESLVASILINPPARAAAWFVGGAPEEIACRRAAARLQAELIGLEDFIEPSVEPWLGLPGGFGEAAMLLAALATAAESKRARVLWPKHVSGDLDAMLDASDRALLVQRIGLIELGDSEQLDVHIDSPLLDLTDRQIAELAVDLEAPLWSCWWALPAAADIPEAQTERRRWAELLRDCGGERLLTRSKPAASPEPERFQAGGEPESHAA